VPNQAAVRPDSNSPSSFDATMKDPDFLAEAEKVQIPIEPNGGENLDKIAKQIVATPTSAVTLAKKLLGSE
jgi:hypothetical protein